MSMLRMCLNWKVIAALAAVAAGLFAFAPGLASAALPFLVLAICPLSMIVMMVMMNGGKGEPDAACSTGGSNVAPVRTIGTPADQTADLEVQQQDLARRIAALQDETARTASAHQVRLSTATREG